MNLSNKLESSVEDFENEDLELLLLAAKEDDEQHGGEKMIATTATPVLRDDDSFIKAFENTPQPSLQNNVIDTLYKPDGGDSSDDEDVKNFLERKYNQYGSDINKALKQKNEEAKDSNIAYEVTKTLQNLKKPNTSNSGAKYTSKNPALAQSFKKKQLSNTTGHGLSNGTENSDVYTDPIFGLRLVKPLIASSMIVERMSGRTPVSIANLSFHIERADLNKDWVIAGVIVSKSPVKTAKNGAPFSVWRLSDLKGDIKIISLFLFQKAHKELWKTNVGNIVAILNPGVLDKQAPHNNDITLSIDSPLKLMILGQSKDLGTCKSKKKNGDVCGAVVNMGSCEFCIYHMKQEFGRMSKRSELQSSTSGRGLQDLRNKVLGKNEVFYGGQSYTAVPARKSAKQTAKDEKRLMTLTEYYQSPNIASVNHISKVKNSSPQPVPYAKRDGHTSIVASSVDVGVKQRIKDLDRLKLLKGESKTPEIVTSPVPETQEPDPSPITQTRTPEVVNKFQNRTFSLSKQSPFLSKEAFDIDISYARKKDAISKMKAVDILKKRPIEKTDPNFIKYRGTANGKKRALEELNVTTNSEMKRQKTDDEADNSRKSRIERIMAATSSHMNLIKTHADEQQEKYFTKLEKKEALEEKMLSTFKVPCKAVICSKCKYTAFSAADRCKEEKHPLKVVDAIKRFFECHDCGNRTATVHKMPKLSCKNCSSSRWKRTAMIREKKTYDPKENLSIRGDEEKYLGSLNASSSINLLVPE